jgi:maleylpyruvate isomerase
VRATDVVRDDFCSGHAPTIADIYLAPQVEGARRFKIDRAS